MQKNLIALALGLSLSSVALAGQQNAALLVYQVAEPGVDPYISRILVTPKFVRLDEGEGAQDFTLYDRTERIMYNVSHEEHSALVLNPPVTTLTKPDSLLLEQQSDRDADAPKIAGRAPENITLLANGKVCRELVAVPGLMPEAMAGLREFHALLGRVQAATLSSMPVQMQTPCDLADNVYAPLRALDHGLPIQERSGSGQRALLDFAPAHPVDEAIFTIPAAYGQIMLPGMDSES